MDELNSLLVPWEGYTGLEVETFLKAQLSELYGRAIGYYIVTPNADDSANVLCGFGTQDDYLEWNALSAEDKWGEAGLAYLLAQAVLPSAEGVDAYTVSISLQSVPDQIQPTNNVSINVKGTSRVIHAGGQGTEDIQETLLVQVQTRINTTVAWQTRGEFPIPANSLDYTTINLQPYLSDGTNYVRVRAVGEYASSIWRSISLNIVNLRLVPIMSPQLPVTDDSLTLLYLVGGAVDLTKCARIEKIDLRGCGCSSIASSDNTALRYLYLPSSITSLILASPANLTDLAIDSTENLIELRITGNSGGVGLQLLTQCVADGATITDLTLENEEWVNPDLSVINYVSNIPNSNIKVRIRIVNQNFTFSLKQTLMAAFGDIDDPNNDVWVDYVPVPLTGLSLSGVEYMASINFDYRLEVVPDPYGGNDFKQVVWSLDNNVNATINPETGVINVIQAGSQAGGEQGTVTLTVTKMDNTILTATKVIKFWQRTLMPGDYVFSDGSYAPDVNGGGGRTAIGRCFYVNPDNPLDRRMVSIGSIATNAYGYNSRGGITLDDGTIVSCNIPGIAEYGNTSAAITGFPINTFIDGRSGSFASTHLILGVRNIVLNGITTPMPVPEVQAAASGRKVWEHLVEDLQQASLRGVITYYWPAASLCAAYEPSVGRNETLDSKFTEGNWYLPSYAELDAINEYCFPITTNTWSFQEHTVWGYAECAWAYPSTNYNQKNSNFQVMACCNF